jgi:hypothetical protein
MAKPPVPRTERGGASRTADRLAARADRGTLRRQAMADGGEVFTGTTASRSLEAIGARAMTVDRSIIVADDFDPNKPEDQALYAHEKYHLDHSGGEGSHAERDAEEIAARAVERMVLHRARGTGDGAALGSPLAPGAGPAAGGSHGTGVNAGGDPKPETPEERLQRGYAALRAEGYTHQAIVDRLAREVVVALDTRRDLRNDRMGDRRGFL